MRTDKINNVNFNAGKISLDKINPDDFKSYHSIKKLAEDRELDVFISRKNETKHLPQKDVYLVMTSKNQPIVDKNISYAGKELAQGSSVLALDKKTGKKELSVKLFNAVMNAIDILDNKLKLKK